jgi:membrane protease YdiL (CAAX protease family)
MNREWPSVYAPIGLVLFFQLASLIVREFVRLRLGEFGVSPGKADHLSAAVGFILLGLLLAPVLWPERAGLRHLFRLPDRWPRIVLSALLAGILLRVASWSIAIGVALSGRHGLPHAPTPATFWWHCPPADYLLLSMLVLALATPVVEETVNRGIVLGGLLARGSRLPLPLSAIVFAMFHAPDNMPVAFLFGLTAGRMMARDRCLLGPVVAHATFNGLTTLDWDCLGGAWTPAEVSPHATLIAFALAIVPWLVSWQLAGGRSPGPGSRPGAAQAATRR